MENRIRRTLRLDKFADKKIGKVQKKYTGKISKNEIINLLIEDKIKLLNSHLLTQNQAKKLTSEIQNTRLILLKYERVIGGLANNLNQSQRAINYNLNSHRIDFQIMTESIKKEVEDLREIRKEMKFLNGKINGIREN